MSKLHRSTSVIVLIASTLLSGPLALTPTVAHAASPAASFSDVGLAGPVPADVPRPDTTAPYGAGPAATPGGTAAAIPSAVSAVPKVDGKAVVTWAPTSDPAALAGTDAMWVQTYTAQGRYLGEQVAAPTATSATVTGLVPGHDYLFGVLTESTGRFSSYRFSPQVRSTGYTGVAGVPLPAPVLPDPQNPGNKDLTVDSLVTYVSQTARDLIATANSAGLLPPATATPVLGREAWQTYENTDAGSGQTASVNVANGNLVLTANDSTPIQAHGQLAYGLRRTYNSLDATTLATAPGSIGAGWRLNLGEELGDTTGTGVLGGALTAPKPGDVSPGAVTLIDRDGTHHVFTPKATSPAIKVSVPGAPVAPDPRPCGVPADGNPCDIMLVDTARLLDSGVGAAGANRVACIDRSYAAPAGVHLALFRYVNADTNSGAACPVDSAAATGATVLGYATVRPDRLRTVYASTGELLSMTDRAGVEMRYVYDTAPSPGSALGHLNYVYEPRSCAYVPFPAGATGPVPLPGNCRGYRLTYDRNDTRYGNLSIAGTPLGALAGSNVNIADPAGRTTLYVLSKGTVQQLLAVINPDGSAQTYTYQGMQVVNSAATGCGAVPAPGCDVRQLSAVTDSLGHTTSIAYEATADSGPLAGGAVASVLDRRGMLKVFYRQPGAVDVELGTPNGARAVQYASKQVRFYYYDGTGRVSRLDESSPGASGYNEFRSTQSVWDSTGHMCTQPTAVVDNNLCSVTRNQMGSDPSAAPSQTTTATYNGQGQPLVVSRATGSNSAPLVTTMGYQQEQLTVNGAPPVRLLDTFHDTIVGNGQVVSDANRPDSLYVLSDATAMLTPRGNQASNYGDYETTYTLDADASTSPGSTDPSCGLGNTGLTCKVDAPSPAGGRALTTYGYDAFGQRTSMVTPKVNAGTPAGQTAPSYTYGYFGDNDTDLSGTTQAGGWLRSVTDPAGHGVAYGYDAAGNVARTWDRDATAGRPLTDFPGTLVAPPNARYAEILHADPGPARDPGPAQLQAAYTQPWRWTWSKRDPLGNRSRTSYDANGNPLRMTSPRGTQLSDGTSSPTTYDTTMTYDAGDLPLTMLTAAEQATASTPDRPTRLAYDVYGNRVSVTDPRGVVTGTDYDPVDRPVTKYWTRGTYDPATAPANCRAATPADGPRFATGITLCSSKTAYDGLDQVIGSTDGTGATTTMTYDALGRRTGMTMPRNNNGIASVQTQTTYDADGNVLDSCQPREFTEGSKSCTAGSVYATHMAYNPAGRITGMTTHRDATTVITSTAGYDPDGNKTSTTDPNGHTTRTAYDLLDRPTGITKPRDTTLAFTTLLAYDPVGNRTTVTVPVDGTTTRVTAYAYDTDNRLTDTVTGADNPDALAAGLPGADGGTNTRTRVVYDADGHTVGAYAPRAFTTSATSPDTRFLTRTDLDPDGRPVAAYSPRYDTGDQTFADPTGNGTTQASDCPLGANPAPVTVPATMPGLPGYPTSVGVCVTRTSYDPAGQPLVTTMPTAGGAQPGSTTRQTVNTWTDDHLLASTTGPSPNGTGTSTTSTRYDAIGKPTSVTDPLGHVSTMTYTSDHLPAGMTTQGYLRASDNTQVTHTTSTAYDAAGQPVTVTDALGQVARTGYTADGLVTSRTDTGGNVHSYGYDPTGNTTSVLSPSGNAKDQTNPGGVAATTTYTADDLPLATLSAPTTDGTRAVSHRVAWDYDQGGLKTSADHTATNPDGTPLAGNNLGGRQLFAYYPNSRQRSETGRGNAFATPEVITSRYDPDGHPLTANDTTGGGSTVTSSYYLDGLARTVDDGRSGTTKTAYDGNGQPLATVQTSPTASDQTSLYTYNDANLPVRQTSSTVTASTTDAWTWAYDAAGRTTSSTTPERQTTSSTYNPDDTLADQTATRPTPAPNTLVSQWRYTYDNLSRELTADGTQLQPGSAGTLPQRQAFTYDPAGRVVTNSDSLGAHTSSYDSDGNRLTYSTPAGPNTAASTAVTHYNADDSIKDYTSGAPGETPQPAVYGPSGVLKTEACTSYMFDGFDRLTHSTPNTLGACGARPAYSENTYTYDALDRQRSNTQITTGTINGTKTAPASSTTAMGYHGQTSTVSTETTDSTPTRRYTLDPGGNPTAMSWSTGTTTSTHHLGTDGDGNVTQVTGLTFANNLGSTGPSGVACATRLNPWGQPLTATPTSSGSTTGAGIGSSPHPCPHTTSDGTPTTDSDVFYRGNRRDNGTGNYQLGTRTYDPSKTAFLSPDTYRSANPVSDLALGTDPLTANRYNYVNGDPVNLDDPTGHRSCGARDGDDLCPGQGSGGSAAADQNGTQYTGSTSSNQNTISYSNSTTVARAAATTRRAAVEDAGAARYRTRVRRMARARYEAGNLAYALYGPDYAGLITGQTTPDELGSARTAIALESYGLVGDAFNGLGALSTRTADRLESFLTIASYAAGGSGLATVAVRGALKLVAIGAARRAATSALKDAAIGAGGKVAAEGTSTALASVPDFADTASAFRHYAAHVKGVRLGSNGSAALKTGGADVPEFGDFASYRSAARSFMSGPGDGTVQGLRSGGDFLRFDPRSGLFGVLSPQGTIRTFFRPDDGLDYFLGQFR